MKTDATLASGKVKVVYQKPGGPVETEMIDGFVTRDGLYGVYGGYPPDPVWSLTHMASGLKLCLVPTLQWGAAMLGHPEERHADTYRFVASMAGGLDAEGNLTELPAEHERAMLCAYAHGAKVAALVDSMLTND